MDMVGQRRCGWDADVGLSCATRSNRRRLSAAKAVKQLPGRGEPTAHLWGNHLLMALVDAEDGSEALQQELRRELAKVGARPPACLPGCALTGCAACPSVFML